ncbi:hypothetical protein DPMN_192620 [Dreissena polymorpha]|uniref:Uncharacterized protein n=1 Tax=Dreissena polymorpha TaxID=45954 RepID=A0A9D3Y3T5_DREPO|nr:hypothetical protein DPMN_192620 [Dreissena polymorpha]
MGTSTKKTNSSANCSVNYYCREITLNIKIKISGINRDTSTISGILRKKAVIG